MSNKAQYNNEINVRGSAEAGLDSRYVYRILATSADYDDFEQKAADALRDHGLVLEDGASYPFAVIMEAGERNLHTIFMHERPDGYQIRSIFTQILKVQDE